VLETHRLEVEEGVSAEDLAAWVREEQPQFDFTKFGFQAFGDFLNFAQDKSVVKNQPDEERGLMVYLGAEFHPPALPEPEPQPIAEEIIDEDEKQPVVPGQPTARSSTVRTAPTTTKRSSRKSGGGEVNGNSASAPVKRTTKRAGIKRPRKTPPPPPGVMQ